MVGDQPARSGAGENINDFMARRRRAAAGSGPRIQAVGHAPKSKAIRRNPRHRVGHPGFAESLIPVWGSAREALADVEDHDVVGGALNTGLAAADLFLAGDIAKAVGKGGLYAITGAIGRPAKEAVWKDFVRPKMGDLGMLEEGQHGHHWFFPQKAKNIPPVIRNHPINIQAMPSAEVHGRLSHRYKGKPRYGLLGRYWHGTPHWSKVATGSAIGHPVAAVQARSKQP